MTDDEPTPQRAPVPSYLRTAAESDEPAVYLVSTPTPEEHILGQQIGLHNGAAVPWWMFAKAVDRVHKHAIWIGRMERFRRTVRRHVWAGIGTLATNLLVIVSFALSHARDSGAAQEHAAAQERALAEYRETVRRELGDLHADIRELRAALRRISGADKIPDSSIWVLPDQLSVWRGNVSIR